MSKRILLVEDEQSLAKLVKQRLEKEGFEVEVTSDGEEALNLSSSFAPDLIILDIMLPGIGGYEVCSRLRTTKITKNTPIIMFTARGGDMDKAMGFQCGANDYIVKPYDPKILLEKIRNLL